MSESIVSFLSGAWQPLLAIVPVSWAVISYLKTHRRELSWKRTEFICSQLRTLDTDPKLLEMLTVLEDRHPDVNVCDIYVGGGRLDKAGQKARQQEMDRFLNFIWCLCFAYLDLRTLTDRNILCVGRYLDIINRDPLLREYCLTNGYSAIIEAAEKVRRPRLTMNRAVERLRLSAQPAGE